eukprot:6214327-Pleurochrysis_carterae.AAC.1
MQSGEQQLLRTGLGVSPLLIQACPEHPSRTLRDHLAAVAAPLHPQPPHAAPHACACLRFGAAHAQPRGFPAMRAHAPVEGSVAPRTLARKSSQLSWLGSHSSR